MQQCLVYQLRLKFYYLLYILTNFFTLKILWYFNFTQMYYIQNNCLY